MAFDGKRLVMSDGSSRLFFLDPKTQKPVRSIQVVDGGRPVERLNELEFVRGELWANVWTTDRIAKINPETGHVTGWIDLAGLLQREARGPRRRRAERHCLGPGGRPHLRNRQEVALALPD